MQVRHAIVEYNLKEAAKMLSISPAALKQAVNAGQLQCYYRLGKNNYWFHEASLCINRDLLSRDGYLTEVLGVYVPDASEVRPLSTPSAPSAP